MLYNKITIHNKSYLSYMWYFLIWGHPAAAFLTYKVIQQTRGIKPPPTIGDALFMVAVFLVYAIVLLLWKVATFTRRDFIRVAEMLDVKFTRKLYYYSLLETIGVYSFSSGYLDNIYMLSKIDIPTFAYAPFKRISLAKVADDKKVMFTGGDGPGYMCEESKVELFSLIKGPHDIDIIIKRDNGKGDIPTTGCQELDDNLNKYLSNVPYFNARLQFNKEYLRLTIVGGSWEGKVFGDKIQTGLKMFKEMNDSLKIKYPVASWDKYEVKWNRASETFYLESR